MKRLWLFDIDGTLVNIDQVHVKSYQIDCKNVLGKEISGDLVVAQFGTSELDTQKGVLDRHVASFKEALANEEIVPLPGVVEFLKELKGEQLGIVTGNLLESAQIILEKSGLGSYFSFVSAGTSDASREEIVASSVTMAREKGFEFDQIVVLGDTTHDIDAARSLPGSVLAIGVASGSVDEETLRVAGADLVVSGLKDHAEIMEFLEKNI
jgi:HAD superfamily hydrolase (TIGR01549 family)